MDGLIRELKDLLTPGETFRLARALHDSYHSFMPESEVWQMLKCALPSCIYGRIARNSESIVGHKLVNLIVMNFYPGEKVLKYYLARERVSVSDEVTAFEIKVRSSRLDLGRINGKSYALEIKTELDSLEKLSRQLCDYSHVFEYVTVVAHESHYNKIPTTIPEHCGIRVYSVERGTVRFRALRKPKHSPSLDMTTQVKSLSSRELEFVLRSIGSPSSSMSREERERVLKANATPRQMNQLFKRALRRRFGSRWAFVIKHFEDIGPIDLQAFFASSAEPYWVYYKNSSSVFK